MNLTSESATLQLQVDREHSGLRLGTVVLFIGIAVVTFLVTNALIASEGFNILAGLVAFGVAALVTRLTEPTFKRLWPSKRVLQLDGQGARMLYDNNAQATIQSDLTANVHFWCFKIPRRGRMPKGWYVIACGLQQDDTYLTAYTFASPAQTTEFHQLTQFTELQSESKKSKSAKTESLRLAGEQRRLRIAEEHRWHDGGELTTADFEAFIKWVNGQHAQWNM